MAGKLDTNEHQVLSTDVRKLPVKLTQAQRVDYAGRLADIEPEQTRIKVELAEMKERHKTAQKELKDQIDGLDQERARVAAAYREGVVLRPVKVDIVADYKRGTKCPFRTDTEEFLETERVLLDDGEKQLHMVPQGEDDGGTSPPPADTDSPTPKGGDARWFDESDATEPATTDDDSPLTEPFGGATGAADRRKYVRACDDAAELNSLLAVEGVQASVITAIGDRMDRLAQRASDALD